MQLRLHVGGSFKGNVPHIYVSIAHGSTTDADMQPVYDDGVCDSAHLQDLRVRIADPTRMCRAATSHGTRHLRSGSGEKTKFHVGRGSFGSRRLDVWRFFT